MSSENQSTLEVYERCAVSYLDGSAKHQQLCPEKEAKKRAWLKDFIRDGLAGLPKNARLFEFGSGGGEDVEIFCELGYQITPSDAPDSFLDIMRKKGLNPLKFNILTDEFPGQYDAIYSWRTLVHLTEDDTKLALRKVYQALKPGGRYIFNILNTTGHNNLDEEWVDFDSDYHLGEKRYFKYWQKATLLNLLQSIGFVPKRLEIGGGNDSQRWFYIIVEKPEENRE